MEDKDVLEAFVLIDVLNEGPSPELPKTKTIKLKPNLEIKDPTFKKLRKRDKSANASPMRKGSLNPSRNTRKHESIRDKQSKAPSREFSGYLRKKVSTRKATGQIDRETNQEVALICQKYDRISIEYPEGSSKPKSERSESSDGKSGNIFKIAQFYTKCHSQKMFQAPSAYLQQAYQTASNIQNLVKVSD
jgi:hypothetical protein